MSDIFTKKKRSQIMASISDKNTKPEIMLAKIISQLSYKYHKNVKTLPGTPDLVFPRRKKVIFVNGCFWHGHKCKRSALPQSNILFWSNKIKTNKLRDKRNMQNLFRLNWEILVVWQCQLSSEAKRKITVLKIKRFLSAKS